MPSATRRVVLVLAYAGFISLGLPDTVLGVAWPTIRSTFGLGQAGLGAVLMAGMCGYIATGLVAGPLSRWLGVGGLLAASCAAVAIAELGYALAPAWALFFPLAAVWGLGSGAIDATLNGYAASHLGVRHLNWLHACWSIGATIGPLLMTASLSSSGSYRPAYAALAIVLAAMGLAFIATRSAWGQHEAIANASHRAGSLRESLGHGRVWLQVGLFFTYTGVETGTGQWCFTVLREAHGLGLEAAGAWTAAFWGSLLVGRVVLGFVVERVGPDRLLRSCTFGAVAGAIVFAAFAGAANRFGLLLLGVSLAPLYPTLMARTPARLGEGVAAHAVGFQVSAATFGAATLPAAIGLIAARAGVGAVAPSVAIFAVLFVALHEVLLRVTRNR